MSFTPANRTTAFLLVVLCASGAGCVHLSSPTERDASFLPYNGVKVGEESLWNYLLVRSGILHGAESLETTSTGEHSFRFTSKPPLNSGTAAAIDQRGYFLTAAHCVEEGQFRLAFLRDGKLQVDRPRIVWRGDEKKGEPDLAILCVSRPIGRTFQWAAEFTNGSPVVDLGLSIEGRPPHLKTQPTCVAGRVLKVSEALSADYLDYTVVSHSSPLRPGDSGGPLVLSDGRLLGINVMVRPDFQWSHLSFEQHSEAHRPDLLWLRKIIDADAALFPGEISSP
jgi:Trypsin-like peptidase domain